MAATAGIKYNGEGEQQVQPSGLGNLETHVIVICDIRIPLNDCLNYKAFWLSWLGSDR